MRNKAKEDVEQTGVQSVMIVLGVMEYLAAREAAGVTEIATALGTTKARVHRHLRTLVAAGYASQDDDGERYAVGSRLIALGHAASLDSALVRIAKPTMARVRDQLGHTVLLDKIGAQGVEIIDFCAGTGMVEISVKRGQSLPLHASVAGKLALAYAEPSGRPALDKRKLTALTPETITDAETLQLELERIRQQGWAAAPEEFTLGINCIGAPIFNQRGQIVAAIALLDSVQFLSRRPTREQISTIIDAAAEITSILALKRANPVEPSA
ncbi:MAG TPA: IclR family transcriptional regulator [Caulobacterales bacterium]|nr:IclR family transcriptional regulator [Caulobacterales bacterium]